MSFQNNHRIPSLMKKLDQKLSDWSNLNPNYSPNNFIDKYQNNFTADLHTQNLYDANQDDFDFASDSDDDKPKNHRESKNILLELERNKRKALEIKLKYLQFLLKKQLTMNDVSLHNLHNRRFKGDGSEDDYLNHQLNQQTNLLPKNKVNYQNNSTSNLNRNNRFSLDKNLDNQMNDYSINNSIKKIDKLIKILSQQHDDDSQLTSKNSCANYDLSNEFNGGSIRKNKNNLTNLTNNLADNQSLNCLDIGNLLNLSNLSNSSNLSSLSNQYNQSNENLFPTDCCSSNLKRQIIGSMKSNFNSMIEFIDNQHFSSDNFTLIQQLINLLMIQNCQFMNHQQVLLSWLQRLQVQMNANILTRFNTLSRDNQLARNQINESDHLFIDNNKFNDQQSSNSHLKHLSSLNNHETKASSNYDHSKLNSFYQNQQNSINNLGHFNQTNSSPFQNNNLSNMKMRNLKLMNKLRKNVDNSSNAPNDLNDFFNVLDELIEDECKSLNQNATGNYQEEYEEQGAVGGVDSKHELNDTTNNLSSKLSQQTNSTNSNLAASNLNNGNHLTGLTNGTNCSTGNNLNNHNINSSSKSPQILHLPPCATRKKQTTRKTPADVIESINLPDDLIKNSETIRPLMAAEGRSSEFINPAPPASNILQSKIISNTKNSAVTTNICSTSSINSITNSNATNQNQSNQTTAQCLLKRPPTTGASRNIANNFVRNDENDTETSDDDLTSNQNQTSPEINSSENETNLNSLQSTQLPSNGNCSSTVAFAEGSFAENHNLDNEQEIDERFPPGAHLNSRNDDSEIRLSGDGEQC